MSLQEGGEVILIKDYKGTCIFIKYWQTKANSENYLKIFTKLNKLMGNTLFLLKFMVLKHL